MFGHRPDGKRIKHLNGFYNVIPIIMKQRVDSMNWLTIEMELEPLREFIKEQKEKTGKVYTYFDILLSSIVRVIALKPEMNRFVVNGRLYQRNHIGFSLALQKSLKRGIESDESTVKCKFTGTESIDQIIEQKDKVVMEAKKEKQHTKTDDLVNSVMRGPYFFKAFLVNFLMWLDKHGLLPMSVLDAIPFHTTFFITDMKSIKLPSLHHHLYNFGTTGLFFSTSAEEKKLYLDPETHELKEKDIMKIAFVSDERFCDGYSFSQACRMLKKIWANPRVLLRELDKSELGLTVDEEWELNRKKEKEAKKQARLEKKLAKRNKNTEEN